VLPLFHKTCPDVFLSRYIYFSDNFYGTEGAYNPCTFGYLSGLCTLSQQQPPCAPSRCSIGLRPLSQRLSLANGPFHLSGHLDDPGTGPSTSRPLSKTWGCLSPCEANFTQRVKSATAWGWLFGMFDGRVNLTMMLCLLSMSYMRSQCTITSRPLIMCKTGSMTCLLHWHVAHETWERTRATRLSVAPPSTLGEVVMPPHGFVTHFSSNSVHFLGPWRNPGL
jgi:hypothetical protein